MPATFYPGESRWRALWAAAGDALMGGITPLFPTTRQDNPAFPLSVPQARSILSTLRQQPVAIPRPVLVLNGYRGPDFQAVVLKEQLRQLTDADPSRWLAVSYTTARTPEAMVNKVLGFVAARSLQSAELDVVSISMGGVVAKLAALDGRGLRIRRLFTLASPITGSRLADRIAPDPAARALRTGGAFLRELDAAWQQHASARGIECISYTRLDDLWVGATRAHPPGQWPIWIEGRGIISHATISRDPRILTDLALRLRGQEPIARPSPPPRD